jgi:hypothetical protein
VLFDPLKYGVGKDDITGLVSDPRACVGLIELKLGIIFSRSLDHMSRIIQARDRGIRKSPGKLLRRVARAATEVYGVIDAVDFHSVEQINAWLRALFGES